MCGSSRSAQTSRMLSSSDDTRFAVNARDTSLRRRVCFGGSVQMIMPVSRIGASVMISTVVPCDDTYVSWFLFAASMSWKRVSTQKSWRSLCHTGASSRIRFQSGYGSSRSSGVNGSQYRSLMVLPQEGWPHSTDGAEPGQEMLRGSRLQSRVDEG